MFLVLVFSIESLEIILFEPRDLPMYTFKLNLHFKLQQVEKLRTLVYMCVRTSEQITSRGV